LRAAPHWTQKAWSGFKAVLRSAMSRKGDGR
jgi:hypothetical protein